MLESEIKQKELHVVRIVNDRQVIVNAGIGEVEIGDRLEIYQVGDEIIDGTTADYSKKHYGDNLGELEYIKATIEVTQIMPKMCICTNSDSFGASEVNSRRLNIDATDIEGGFENFDPKVRKGDPVRKVIR